MSDNEKNNETNISNEYSKTIDMREKRIGIIFKIIYSFAILFGAIFLDLTKRDFAKEFYIYSGEACILAFFLVTIIFLIMYIFTELKCMKFLTGIVTKDQIQDTERAYSLIFFVFPIALLTSLISFMIIINVDETVLFKVLDQYFVIKIFFVMFVFFLITLFVRDSEKRWKIRRVFLGIIITITFIYTFMNIGTLTSVAQSI